MYYVLSLICLLGSFFISACELTVRFEQYGLQAQKDRELGWHGLDVDFAKALLTKAGCSYRFVSAPWGRAIKMLEAGELDLVLSVSDTPARREFAYLIGPQRQETIVFAQHKDAFLHIETMADLLQLEQPIAIQRGAFYGHAFVETMESLQDPEQQFIYVADNDLKINLLQHNRISGFFEEKHNLLFQIEHNPAFEAVAIHPFIVNREPVYYAFSKKSVSQDEIQRLENAFHVLKNSGELKAILSKYKLN